jgi:hypothetical protein
MQTAHWTTQAHLMARVDLARKGAPRFDCLDISDWRKARAIRTGTIVER